MTRKTDCVGTAISMSVLATVAVLLRFQARRLNKAGLHMDDYLVVAALACCIALSTLILIAVYVGGLGSNLVLIDGDIPANLNGFIIFSKMLWALQFISVLGAGFAKLSVLFFYKRLFATTTFQPLVWTMIALVSAWTISLFLANLLDCLPISNNWRQTANVSGKCINIIDIFWAVVISDILTDVIILLLPWSELLRLKMSTSRKLQVGLVLALGWFVVAAGIIRTVLSAPGVTSGSSDNNFTYSRAPAVYWTLIEVAVGVISACAPTFRPLIAHYHLQDIFSSLKDILSHRDSSIARNNSSEKPPKDEKIHEVEPRGESVLYSTTMEESSGSIS